MDAIEPEVRKYCEVELGALDGADEFDIVEVLAAKMAMRVIGMLLGIPESDQQAIREQTDSGLHLDSADSYGTAFEDFGDSATAGSFGEYLDWRMENPSDDVMTQLVHTKFEDHTGVTRTLTREEVLGYVNLLAGAGDETTTRLIGHARRTLADLPDQHHALRANPDLLPNAVEEMLRFEAPSPVQARFVAEDVEYCGQTVPAGAQFCWSTARRTTTIAGGATRPSSTKWTARSITIRRSGTACTSAWVLHWHASRAASPSTRAGTFLSWHDDGKTEPTGRFPGL